MYWYVNIVNNIYNKSTNFKEGDIVSGYIKSLKNNGGKKARHKASITTIGV